MTFLARMTRSPRPFDTELGGDTAQTFDDLPKELQELIGGVAGSSPYLSSLLNREGDWLRGAFDDSVFFCDLSRITPDICT